MSSLSMATAGCCARVAATNIESTSIAGSANLKGILRSSRGRKKYHVRHPGPQAVEDSDSGNCCGCGAAAVDGGGAACVVQDEARRSDLRGVGWPRHVHG